MGLWRGDRRKAWEREEEVWLIKTWLLKGQNNWTKWNTDTLNYDDKHNSIQFINYWSFWREKPADPPDLKFETTVGTSCLPKYWKNIITPACMQILPLFFLAPGRFSCALIYCIVVVQLIKVMLLHHYSAQPPNLWVNQSACMNYWLKCSRLTAWHLHSLLERIIMTEMKNTGCEHMYR